MMFDERPTDTTTTTLTCRLNVLHNMFTGHVTLLTLMNAVLTTTFHQVINILIYKYDDVFVQTIENTCCLGKGFTFKWCSRLGTLCSILFPFL